MTIKKLLPFFILPFLFSTNTAVAENRPYTSKEVEISTAQTARLWTVCDFITHGDITVPRGKEYIKAKLNFDKTKKATWAAGYLTRKVLKAMDYECDFLIPKWYPK